VHVEGFYLMQHVPASCSVPILLVEQNVEYSLWEQRAAATRDAAERTRNLREYALTVKHERKAWRRARLCAAVTEDDRLMMSGSSDALEVGLVPDGTDHLRRRRAAKTTYRRAPQGRARIVYIANFAYQPNIDGAIHLCTEIFPLVRSRVPNARLVLVGNAPPPEVRALASRGSRIRVTGTVRSVTPYLRSADVVVCPLRIGGGIKVKMLEALNFGKATVSTSVGVQGLPGIDRSVVVQDDPELFARSVGRILTDARYRRSLERAAAAYGQKLPTWREAAESLANCYERLSALRTQAPAPTLGQRPALEG
jgi:glycosyltransferase involved in cell wall biosynthesis